jgi:methylglutaconyl-CoA hydratase
VIAELTAWAQRAAADRSIRVVVLSGAGKVFSAGADASWMARMVDYSRDDNVRDATRMAEMFLALDTMPAAVIGRIQGAALGGGSGLAAICDIAVAADDAVFGFTETKLGILPAVISPYVLPKIGPSAARELFLTGMRFPAERARAIGLVHAVVPAAELDAAVDRYVAELLSASPTGIAASKRLIPQVWGRSPREAMAITAEAIAAQRVSPEGQEGLRAFLDKRRPRWLPDEPRS